jgi:hypothetical protein
MTLVGTILVEWQGKSLIITGSRENGGKKQETSCTDKSFKGISL